MNYKIFGIIISMFLFATTINGQNESDLDKFTVQVDGLGCPFCAYGLEKKFKELKGIKDVKIDMETGIMNFVYPPDKQLTIEQVESQVEKAGYTPVSVEILRSDGTVEKTEQKETVLSEGDETKTIEFFVAGNCNMCKSRIEKAAKGVDGVLKANWNKKTKKIKVELLSSGTQKDIELAISKAGHDTETELASNDVYDKLPGCCKYDRKNN